ncbi:MAG TPA: NUDIX domain-containing protein [Candidatus Paceibacterota bacterium]|nr:NUDIX domain-containing protein [Candidatus Paceibacterota bacterium]
MNDWVCFGYFKSFPEEDVVLIQDANKPQPHKWKLPGGKKKRGELYYVQTLDRELREELPDFEFVIRDYKPVFRKTLDGHEFLIFKGEFFQLFKRISNSIRKANTFSRKQILRLLQEDLILENHADFLRDELKK